MNLRFCVAQSFISAIFIGLFVAPGNHTFAAASFRIVVLEGDGAINNVRARTARAPVIEVRDENDAPVAGAIVTFQTPQSGPSAVFPEDKKTFITQTDSSGRATGRGLRPNSITGRFEIRVTASLNSQMTSSTIAETNAAPVEAKSSKKIWILGLAAGAAAGGAFAASHGGKSSTAATPNTSGAPVPGSPSFGPPH